MGKKTVFTPDEVLWITNFSRKYGVRDILIKMILLVEDKRFLNHRGIDFIAIIRATIINIKYLGIKQGASTISQQLSALENKKTSLYKGKMRNKIKKLLGAIKIESIFSKEEILCEYLKKVYFGKSYFGIHAAANGYFHCKPNYINIAQSFFLAERIALPNKVRLDRIERILKRPEVRVFFNKKDLNELKVIYKDIFGITMHIRKY